jgi:hypothetical protein
MVGDGLGVVGGWLGWFGAGLGLVWGSGGGQWDGEVRVTIRAGLLSHWPAEWTQDRSRIQGDVPRDAPERSRKRSPWGRFTKGMSVAVQLILRSVLGLRAL